MNHARTLLLFILFNLSFLPAKSQNADSLLRGKFIVNDIIIKGNFKTKAAIIRRELTFKKNDTLYETGWGELKERSRENLKNTSLFNFIYLDTLTVAPHRKNVTVTTDERWYILPVPIFQVEERNFNTWWEQDHRSLDKADYGIYFTNTNTRGRKEILRLKVQLGYTQQLGLTYIIPYITKNQDIGLQYTISYSQNHEVPYTSVGNILTYLKTPNATLQQVYSSAIDLTYRQGLYNTHYLEVNFQSCRVNDTILALTYDYLPHNQYYANIPGAKYYFRRDFRDYLFYPLAGYYTDFSINDYGLNLFSHSFNFIYLQSSFHFYRNLGGEFYYSGEIEGKVSSNGPQPYFVQRGLGYNADIVRGYEYYVIDGNDYALVKNEIKFRLLDIPYFKIPYLEVRQINRAYYSVYLTAFTDWGYVGAEDVYTTNNFLAETALFGNGFGLDLVTYYDLVLRMEYSFNQLKQSGFFLHFQAAM